MPVTNYHTVNGRLIGETTSGVRTDYLTDALGSITATMNESAQIINTYRYKPFGERLAKTGSGADPRFQFTGDTGSVTTSRRYADNYNRRRSLDVKNGRWGTVDPIWPGEAAYRYAGAAPTSTIDPSGLQPCGPPPSLFPPPGGCKERNAWVYAYCNYCHRCPTAPRGCAFICNHYASDYYNWSHCKPRGTGLSIGNNWYPNPGMGNQITPPRPCGGWPSFSVTSGCPPYSNACEKCVKQVQSYHAECFAKLYGEPPRGGTSLNNSIGHCTLACIATVACGIQCAGQHLHQLEILLQLIMPEASSIDVHNNEVGFSIGFDASGYPNPYQVCFDACSKASLK